MKKIAIGADHAGYLLKNEIRDYLLEKGYHIKDLGTNSGDSIDYSDYGFAVGESVSSGDCDFGILVCGTGIGISMAANKVRGIRCAVCSEPCSARLSREHNNSNCLAFGSRIVGLELAKMIVDSWLGADYSGGDRHGRRLQKIADYENSK